MQPGSALWLCGHLAEFRNALVLTFDRTGPHGEDERGALVVEELEDLHSSIGKWMESNAPYLLHVRPIERALEGDAPLQAMLCGTVERMRRAEARLLESPEVAAVGDARETGSISLNRTEYPERDLSIVDILPAGCSKGAAILRLAASWGIAPEEIMACGDNWNDLSMLEIAGAPVLMGNAPADLLTMAADRGWMVSAAHDQDGVALAIEAVLPDAVDAGSKELVGLVR